MPPKNHAAAKPLPSEETDAEALAAITPDGAELRRLEPSDPDFVRPIDEWEKAPKRPYPIPEGLVLRTFVSCVPWLGPDSDVEEGFVTLGSNRAQDVTAELDEDFTLTVTSTSKTTGEQRVQVFPKGLTSVIFGPPPKPAPKREEP